MSRAPTHPRLFAAVALPDPAREEIRRALDRVLGHGTAPGRIVPPENWHLTARYLGATEPPRADVFAAELQRRLRPFRAFELTLGGLGGFPNARRARVLWMGVREGLEPLRAIAAAAEAAARTAGFPAEARAYAPHLTLSRITPGRDVRRLIEVAGEARVRFEVGHITLFRSDPGPSGPLYRSLDRFTLGHRPELDHAKETDE